MFNNKYQHVNSLTLLKARRPRKAVTPQSPELANFLPYGDNLKRLANFGLEFMKFLPKLEQVIYAGPTKAEEGEGVELRHGGKSTWITQEYWDALNEYGLTVEEARNLFRTGMPDGSGMDIDGDGWGASDEALVNDLRDMNGDGKITNYDTIAWVERNGLQTDGYTQWRGKDTWIHGQHHRTGETGIEGNIGGSGRGASFTNLDFIAEASEWNHIGVKGDKNTKSSSADFVSQQAYFINGLLANTGISWAEINNFLANDPRIAGKSYYQVILSRSYADFSPREATMFVAAMHESRERAWSMMSEVFGPVNQTQNDQAMMPYMRDFLNGSNPYLNHHAISFFSLFLPIQHSVQNRLTTFFEQGMGDGWESSILDRHRFYEFTQWCGRGTFDSKYADSDAGYDDSANMLYQYRNSLGEGSAGYNAVNNLISGWFGATKPENGRPIWESYRSSAYHNHDAADDVEGTWVTIPSTLVRTNAGGSGWHNHFTTRAFVVNNPAPSYAWDKKFTPYLFVKEGDSVGQVNTRSAGWADVMHHLWSQGAITSHINPDQTGQPHPQYIVGQFHNLSYNTMMSGPVFANNWAVYSQGMLMKWGQQLSLTKVMEKCSAQRVASAELKQDITDYKRRQEELEDEEQMEQRIAAQQQAKQRQKGQKANKGQQNNKPGAAAQQQQQNNEAKIGSKDYQKALMKMAEKRMFARSKQHRANLKKMTNHGG